jgi:hypothetical protein
MSRPFPRRRHPEARLRTLIRRRTAPRTAGRKSTLTRERSGKSCDPCDWPDWACRATSSLLERDWVELGARRRSPPDSLLGKNLASRGPPTALALDTRARWQYTFALCACRGLPMPTSIEGRTNGNYRKSLTNRSLKRITVGAGVAQW